MDIRTKYEKLYKAATYKIHSVPPIPLKIDERNPELVKLMKKHQLKNAAIITPCNPGSCKMPMDYNERRIEFFKEILEQRKYFYLPADNCDKGTGHWHEPSFWITDIRLPEAKQLAIDFGQNAFVYTTSYAAPRLIWLIKEKR